MSKIAVLAKLTAAPGKRDELLEKFQSMLDAVQSETGCELYLAHTKDDEPDSIYMYELYSDQASADAHMGSDAMKNFIVEAGSLFGGPPQLDFVKLHGGKGA